MLLLYPIDPFFMNSEKSLSLYESYRFYREQIQTDPNYQLPKLTGSSELLRAISQDSLAIYGGSFNPAHYGHLDTMERVIQTGVKNVLVCPHSNNPTKQGMFIPMRHRIKMLELLAAQSPIYQHVFIADTSFISNLWTQFEFIRATIGPQCKLYIAIGNDSIKEDYPQFFRQTDHIVILRKGYANDAYKRVLQKYRTIESSDISSTKFRQDFESGHVEERLRPVYEYVLKNKLHLFWSKKQ